MYVPSASAAEVLWIKPNAASIAAIAITGITRLHERCFQDRNANSRTRRNASAYPIIRNKWTNVSAGVILKGANPVVCVTFSRLSRIVARVGERILNKEDGIGTICNAT